MKSILYITLCAVLLSGISASCKKGEDDPFLSLRSRKARLAGEWTLSKKESSYKSDNTSTTFTETSSYDGTTETGNSIITENGQPAVESYSYTSTYSCKYTFDKDGTYQIVTTTTSSVITETGVWSFVGKSREKELKNKEAILLTKLSGTSSYTNGTNPSAEEYTGVTGAAGKVFLISRLANKEMVLEYKKSSSDQWNSYSEEMNLTLTQ